VGYIQIEGVSKAYGGFQALSNFSLDVKEGEFIALLGPSGCGKTTLLRSIAGLEDIQGGTISIGDRVVSRAGYSVAPEKRNLGLIFQSYALWPHMRVFGNIAYSLKIRGWAKDAIRDRVREVLEMVGLGGLEHRYPSELSGGQMQRVAVARSLAPNPDVLLFDEPLSNLDAKLRERMRLELRELQRQVGTTAVYVTHDQGEAMAISDRIVLMNKGAIVQVGTGRELYESPRTRFAAEFVGVSNFLPARVLGEPDLDGVVDLETDGGARLRGQGSGNIVGEQVVVSIRPENVVVRPGDAADGTGLAGVIEDVIYLGGVGDVFVHVGDTRLRAQALASGLVGLEAGGTATVQLSPRDVRVLSVSES
jgi:ABC-type Fe3+/spermidine/putrescine transport system ATPase subunit